MNHTLESIAAALAAEGKGILAADETPPTLTQRFEGLGIQSTEQSRRTYREVLYMAPGDGSTGLLSGNPQLRGPRVRRRRAWRRR